MKNLILGTILWLIVPGCAPQQTDVIIKQKPRTIVTTDGEIDDVDSFIRMLLYTNEFTIEGLVYSSSMWHYKGDGKGTPFTSEMEMTKNLYGEQTDLRWPGTTWMQELIAEYGKVYPNLIKHAEGFPHPDSLLKMIKVGNIDFEGEMEKVTEGSEYIKANLLNDNPEPIYLQVWGGTNTIARALKSIEESYKNTEDWDEIYEKVCAKTVIYAILDQDATYRNYISVYWPDVRIYYNSNQFWCFAYPWKSAVPEEIQPYMKGAFMSENIILNHGPLLEKYYSWGDGQKQEGDPEHTHGDLKINSGGPWGTFEKYDFISEGDSPAYFHLIDVGLDNLDNPHFGGWGGRLIQSDEQPNRWEDNDLVADFNPYTNQMDKTFPQTRWVKTLQNDFASRADWCVMDYASANHPPMVSIVGSKIIEGTPGDRVVVEGQATDPDGDKINYKWWVYDDVGTYDGNVNLDQQNSHKVQVTIPRDIGPGETIHVILEASDDRDIPMTRYQRVIIIGK